jgi:hypothetical protein
MSHFEPRLIRLVRCPRCGLEGAEGNMTFHDCRPAISQTAILIAAVLVIFAIITIVRLAHGM